MKPTTTLRELSQRLLNLALHCTDKSNACPDEVDAAWLNGTARGYMMASRILDCHASELAANEAAERIEHEHAGQCLAADSVKH